MMSICSIDGVCMSEAMKWGGLEVSLQGSSGDVSSFEFPEEVPFVAVGDSGSVDLVVQVFSVDCESSIEVSIAFDDLIERFLDVESEYGQSESRERRRRVIDALGAVIVKLRTEALRTRDDATES